MASFLLPAVLTTPPSSLYVYFFSGWALDPGTNGVRLRPLNLLQPILILLSSILENFRLLDPQNKSQVCIFSTNVYTFSFSQSYQDMAAIRQPTTFSKWNLSPPPRSTQSKNPFCGNTKPSQGPFSKRMWKFLIISALLHTYVYMCFLRFKSIQMHQYNCAYLLYPVHCCWTT